ncbi:DUF6151 family protein [Glaciecola sp. 1036]|uniref:DUF6151 family protein n=1 Tax=Alteromonadaceae TaxID=72275 RepID=UPI003D02EB6B
MSEILPLECACGSVKGELKVVKSDAFHVQCLCCDCQKYATELGTASAVLDAHGASDLFQTYPSYLQITQGQENISCMQLSPKGLFRWHTSCCNMPIANTLRSAKVPFVGISTTFMKFGNGQTKDQCLGPVILKAYGRHAIGNVPEDVHPTFPKTFLPKILWFMLKGKIFAKHQPSVFFPDGHPLVESKLAPKN